MATFTCKTCNHDFKKKLTLKEKTERFKPQFCSQDCALAYKTITQKTIFKKTNNRTPQSSKEEVAFGALLSTHFPRLTSQYKIKNYEHHYDFYCPELNILIEYNGTYWHNMPKNRIKDRKHLQEATKARIRLSVVTDKDWKLFTDSGMPDKKKLIMFLDHTIKNQI